MPCGGINFYYKENFECLLCGKRGAKHFCEEWDCGLHAECIPEFLLSEEGKLMIQHNHEVHIYFGEDKKE